MPYKLDQIREIVARSPKQYPKTKHLVDDGEYDVGVLDKTMREDLFSFNVDDFVPLNPFHQKTLASLSANDLAETKARDELTTEAARALGRKAFRNPGMESCRKCIDFIQKHGRNSEASQELVANLQPDDTIYSASKYKLG